VLLIRLHYMWERIKRALTLRILGYAVVGGLSAGGASFHHWFGATAAARPEPSATPSPAPASPTPAPSPLQTEYAELVAARQKLDVNDQTAVTSFNAQVAKYSADRAAVAKLMATPTPAATPSATPPATPAPRHKRAKKD
jgi:hypothetical protein